MYLNCHTYFSLLYGTLSPAQLVRLAQLNEVKALALTDINNTSCAVEFVTRCHEEGIHPVLGIDFRREGQCLYIGLARNAAGWAELNQHLNTHTLHGKPLELSPPPMQHAWIIYPRLIKPITQFRDNELLGIRPEHVARLFNHKLLEYQHKLVILSPVTFPDEDGYRLHQLLRAIDLNTVLSKLKPTDIAKKTELLFAPDIIRKAYRLYPKILENTMQLLTSCKVDWPLGLGINRRTFTGTKEGDFGLLEKLTYNGCRRRYGEGHEKAGKRIQAELRVIREHDFCAYFLITWDIVRYARAMHYRHVGRGSGANSIVAYCLGITDVDPLELDLYFERFINPRRSSPPDFDIDFSWDDRDDVIDYICKRYGAEHTALLAVYNTFQGRSIIRELGKVLGLPKAEIDRIGADPLNTGEHHPLAREILRYGEALEGFPHYLSIHAGGILIAESPLCHHTALQAMPKGFPVAHVDMYHAEQLGFHKFDVLSQRGLGHIKDAVVLVQRNQGRAVDIDDIERIKTDEGVKAQLRAAKCIGCFYIESPAMRGLLRKLRCDNYPHLVAASSIIRPGVAQSGMMREYIHRYHNPYGFDYPHPTFREHLAETFGVMVYQEDVMKIAYHFAGLGLDEGDLLRRMMTGKKYDATALQALRRKFFDNCRSRGYPDALTAEVWRQMESFGGYSFCKAHSASFAVESFQSLFLKTYFPLEFIVAVINNFGGFYGAEFYFHEARLAGGKIHAPCVNHSQYLTDIQDKDIYIGWVHIKGLEAETARRIVRQRETGGPYRDLEHFLERVDIGREQIELLIRIGAFRFTGRSKYDLMWEKNALLHAREKFDPTVPMFREHLRSFSLPSLEEGRYDQAFDEFELLGFPLCSPFELLAGREQTNTGITVNDLPAHVGRVVQVTGYFVCYKKLYTVKQQLMAFGTWLDHQGEYFDTVHFPEALMKYPFRGRGIYRIEGKVVEEFDFPSLEVTRLERLPYVGDGRFEG